MFTLTSSMLWRGVLSVAVGIVAVVWPDVTVAAFVILFAVSAFLTAAAEAARAFRAEAAGPVAGRLLLAALDVVAGVVALVWPGITVVALVLWVAAWAIVTGGIEIALAVRAGRDAGERALLAISGLLAIALGVVLAARPGAGALALAQVYGLFSLASGAAVLVTGIGVRRLAHGPSRAAAAA
jgi:uncharacterized membrane protein HdeD (DUF308 family)